MTEKKLNIPGLTDAETKNLKSQIKEYLENLEEIRKFVANSQGTVGQLMKDISKLYKTTTEKAKQTASKSKKEQEEVLDVGKWFFGDKDPKSIKAKEDYGFLGDATDKMSDEFSDELQKMILGYSSFTESIKRIGDNMVKYILKSAVEGISGYVFSPQNIQGVAKGLGGFLGPLFGKLGGLFKGGGGSGIVEGRTTWERIKQFFLRGRVTFHDGGIVPSGANYSLPGTKEQLAMLKGGERVLSPAENTSYNSNSGGSPVVFNNFNVKAWDSKDVSKYLLENKQLLNAITFEGIKYNNGHLRTMVRNA